jgi:hypothetical protein
MCYLVSSRAFRQSSICCHCAGMRKITHTGALCSHGTKNNQHNSSTQPQTQPQTQPHTMSDSTICPCLLQRLWVQLRKTAAAAPPQHDDQRRVTRVWSDSDGRGSGGAVYWGAYSGQNLAGGGFDTLAKSRWEDRIRPSIPVQKINHTTINRQGPLYVRRIGRGAERWPCLWRRKLGGIFDAWGGGRHGQLVTGRSISMGRSLSLHKTPQSTSVWLGWG